MAHLSPAGTAVLSVFLIMAIVCPLILIKFWGPKHGTYGRRGKRDWDDDDQYDRRRRRKRGVHEKRRSSRGASQRWRVEQGEEEVGDEMHMRMHTRYRPEGDWTSSAPPLAPAPGQQDQLYAGAYGLPPPGHGSGPHLGRSEDNRGNYSALPTGVGSGAGPGTPPPATPAPRYTPGGYRAPSSQPHTPSGLRCASLPHLAEEEEHTAAAAAGPNVAYTPGGSTAYGYPSAGYQSSAPTSSPPGQSNSSWLRKSSIALGRPLELVIGPARSQPRSRDEERMDDGAAAGGGGGQVQQLGEWKKGVPLRPLEAVVAHPERAVDAYYLPPHTSHAPFIAPPPLDSSRTNQPGGHFALPALPTSQPLFEAGPRPQGDQHSPPAPAPGAGA